MGFWILVFLSIAATAAVLARGIRRPQDGDGGDLAIYRAQLQELDRDAARGLLSPDEAAQLRLEISRRLLAADKAGRAPGLAGAGGTTAGAAGPATGDGAALRPLAQAPGGSWQLALLLAGITLAGAVLVYRDLGAPGYADLPREARLAAAAEAKANRPAQAQIEAALPPWTAPEGADPAYLDLVAQLRTAVAANPDQAQGWELLARHETALGNPAAAWRALEQLLTLRAAAGQEASADDFAQLGEWMIQAAGGLVSPEAETALTRALLLEPTQGSALFYAGLLYLQTGRPDRTFEIWAPLLANSPADAPWSAPIRERIGRVAMLAGQIRYQIPPESAAPRLLPGPDAAAIEAAAAMDPADREAFIRGMVESLSARLASSGGTAEEWARLIRVLGVLGDTARAEAIWNEAQVLFALRPRDLDLIRTAAIEAGLQTGASATGAPASDGAVPAEAAPGATDPDRTAPTEAGASETGTTGTGPGRTEPGRTNPEAPQ